MKNTGKTRSSLDEKFQKIVDTPASFDFFVSIHDFIEYIELNRTLSKIVARSLKADEELGFPNKYKYLKQIYRGVEDINTTSKTDLGHERYSAIRDLSRIQNNDATDSNSFWKKRDLSRKLVREIYATLISQLSGAR